MAMVVTCKVCHVEYEPVSIDIMAGVWQVCPACRADGAPKPRGERRED